MKTNTSDFLTRRMWKFIAREFFRSKMCHQVFIMIIISVLIWWSIYQEIWTSLINSQKLTTDQRYLKLWFLPLKISYYNCIFFILTHFVSKNTDSSYLINHQSLLHCQFQFRELIHWSQNFHFKFYKIYQFDKCKNIRFFSYSCWYIANIVCKFITHSIHNFVEINLNKKKTFKIDNKMSQQQTVRITTTETSHSSALIINTGYLATPPGILKLLQFVNIHWIQYNRAKFLVVINWIESIVFLFLFLSLSFSICAFKLNSF